MQIRQKCKLGDDTMQCTDGCSIKVLRKEKIMCLGGVREGFMKDAS